jgi:hypothetical protein
MGYLQRLAQRAEGVSSTPSLVPAPQNFITRDSSSDPFTSDEAPTSFVRPMRARTIGQDHFADLNVEREEPSPEVASRVSKAKAPLMDELSKVSPTERATYIQQPALDSSLSRVEATPSLRKREYLPIENEPSGKAETQKTPKSEIFGSLETQRSLEEKIPPETPIPMVVTSKLEPPLADILRPEPLPSDEPRVVIGQLKVDVIPSAPIQAREVVRTVTRTAGPNQSTKLSSPISRRRFGLGQM